MRPTTHRIASIDILRGLVMIIMALDHTRDFFHATAMTANPLSPDTTTIPLYFTRWITHFCAPTFVFLSGLSAYLSSQKKSSAEASIFLINRGLWLVFVELVIVTFGITFDPKYRIFILQVIWAIGWSMVLLGIIRQLPAKWVLGIGLLVFFGHDLFNYANIPRSGTVSDLIKGLFTTSGNFIPVNSTHFIGDFYAIIPWTGVMLAGYGIGYWFKKDYSPAKRKRNLLVSGLSLTLLFIVLRLVNKYGDPSPRVHLEGYRGILSFLNASKYPPSLMYSCMTLGPGLVFLAFTENLKSKFTQVVSVYGKVPFFYYILHFYILHILLMAVFFITGNHNGQLYYPASLMMFRPQEFGYSLWITYTIWISVVASLYFPCRWFYKYKMNNGQWWLSYL